MRVLIVDDEPLARERVRTLLQAETDVDVVGECSDGRSAAEAILRLRPDVVFLDVQMPGMTGFEVVAAIGVQHMPAVIFVTAYDEFALKAFDAHAVDYLVKPFPPERLQAALRRARAQRPGIGQSDLEARLRALLRDAARDEYAHRFLVQRGHKFIFVRSEEIQWIEAANNYVRLHTGDDFQLLRTTIGALEERLDPRRFVRVHRSAIVNLDHLQSMETWGHGEYQLKLTGGAQLTSSRTYRARLRDALGSMESRG